MAFPWVSRFLTGTALQVALLTSVLTTGHSLNPPPELFSHTDQAQASLSRTPTNPLMPQEFAILPPSQPDLRGISRICSSS